MYWKVPLELIFLLAFLFLPMKSSSELGKLLLAAASLSQLLIYHVIGTVFVKRLTLFTNCLHIFGARLIFLIFVFKTIVSVIIQVFCLKIVKHFCWCMESFLWKDWCFYCQIFFFPIFNFFPNDNVWVTY